MKFKSLAVTALTICSAMAATSASAVTVTPDVLIIESNENRGNGTGVTIGDSVAGFGLGNISGQIGGIAGRIVGSVDTFTFQYDTTFNVDFVNLFDTGGVDIDMCQGFDGSDCSSGSANNEPGRTAIFSLDNGVDPVLTAMFTSTVAPGTSIFFDVAPGTYTFTIDGTTGTAGSAYDVAISAVPVPAGLPLLLSALGIAGFAASRKRKS